jgi:hypothetical protein
MILRRKGSSTIIFSFPQSTFACGARMDDRTPKERDGGNQETCFNFISFPVMTLNLFRILGTNYLVSTSDYD